MGPRMGGKRSYRSPLLQGWVVTGHSDFSSAGPLANAVGLSHSSPGWVLTQTWISMASATDEETMAQRFPDCPRSLSW